MLMNGLKLKTYPFSMLIHDLFQYVRHVTDSKNNSGNTSL